jgi:hypothetical protein
MSHGYTVRLLHSSKSKIHFFEIVQVFLCGCISLSTLRYPGNQDRFNEKNS